MNRVTRALRPVLAVSATLGVVATSACGDDSGEQTTLVFLNAHAGAYEPVAEAFEENNPGVDIELQSVPFDQLVAQTQARLASGDTSIDIVSVDPPRLANMVDQGFLTNESEYLPQMQDTVSEVGINSVTADGDQWAYPLWTSDNFLFYNKKALAQAGVEAPGPRAEDRLTWEQVLADARTVMESEATRYGFAIEQVDRYYALQPMLESGGAGSGLSGQDQLTPQVDTQQWQQFGQWYQDLYAGGISPRGVSPEQMPDLFMTGQVAYFLAGPAQIGQFQDGDFADNWGMAPHPHFADGEVVTPTDSWAIGISATSENKELAREFVQFATLDPEGAALASSVESLPPVNTEALPAYLDYLADVAPEQTSGFEDLLTIDSERYARHRPTSVGYVQFEDTMNSAFADIRNGGDVADVLAEAQSTLTRQLGRQRELSEG